MRFTALSSDAQQRAVQWARETDHFDFELEASLESEIDQWYELLENIGYDDPKIHYNLSYSQGDYCRFEAKIRDPAKYIKLRKELRSKYRRLLNALPSSTLDIVVGEHVNVDFSYWARHYSRSERQRIGELHQMVGELELYIKWEREEIAKRIKRALQNCIEYWWKDENIANALSEIDIEFDWEGKPI